MSAAPAASPMPTTLARLAALALTLLVVGRGAAAPRDELLRLAAPDATFVLVVQNPRDHLKNLSESPFAAWFPTTRLGKQLFDSGDFRKALEGGTEVFRQLGISADDMLNDVLGDAIVVAVTPGPKDERSVILVRPRKPQTMQKVIDRVNELQKGSGELKAVVAREHKGTAYFERQRGEEPSEFYFLRGGVFAFSESEPDLRAVIDRERAAAPSRELADRLTRLGVADAAVAVLINPRSFDAQVRAKVADSKPDEQKLLATFEHLWKALDGVAFYLELGRDLEAGAAVRFRPDGVPAALKPWLLGPRTPSGLWESVPNDALVAVAGRVRVSELIETLAALVPDDGKNGLTAGLNQILGPAFGRDKLSAVLDAIGPDWAIWVAPPAADAGPLPAVLAALRVRTDGPDGAAAANALEQAVALGLQLARFSYNGSHADQIDLRETRDGDAVIRTLVNDKGFPPGVRPSVALKKGYLLLATSPTAIEAFRPPAAAPKPGDAPLIRVSGAAVRSYLQAHRAAVAKMLSDAGAGPEKDVLTHLDEFAAVLELFDRVELLTRGDDAGCRLTVRVTFAKPLKK